MFDHVNQFRVGDRVQLHPATDAWMAGDCYGNVVRIGRINLHVRMDRSGKVRKVAPCNIFDVYPQKYWLTEKE